MHLTPGQSFAAHQASSTLAQRETNPAHQPGAFHPGQCLHQPCSSGFQLPKANLSTKKRSKESTFTHPQHCPEDELNYNITKKQPWQDSFCDFAMEELPSANPNAPDKTWKRETKSHVHFERVFWQKCKITGGHSRVFLLEIFLEVIHRVKPVSFHWEIQRSKSSGQGLWTHSRTLVLGKTQVKWGTRSEDTTWDMEDPSSNKWTSIPFSFHMWNIGDRELCVT